MILFSSIGVILNLLLIIGQLNADEEFDPLTADNINISHVGFSGERYSPQIVHEDKDFWVRITDINSSRDEVITVYGEGEDHRELESENDLYSFGVSEPIVRTAAALHFLKWPEPPIYYGRSMPWGDLFEKFDSMPAQVNLIFEHVKLLNFIQTDVSLKTQTCENRSNKTIHCSSSLSEEVVHTVSNTWSNSHAVKSRVSVGVRIVLVKSQLNFEYQAVWGESRTESKSVKISSSGSGDVTLKPGEGIRFTLMSSFGTWRAQVVYRAYLSDDILSNYYETYNGHHFWFADLPYLLRFDNIDKCGKINTTREVIERMKKKYEKTIEIKQIIEMSFYANSSVVATDIFSL